MQSEPDLKLTFPKMFNSTSSGSPEKVGTGLDGISMVLIRRRDGGSPGCREVVEVVCIARTRTESNKYIPGQLCQVSAWIT
jgi:hypothetical protein